MIPRRSLTIFAAAATAASVVAIPGVAVAAPASHGPAAHAAGHHLLAGHARHARHHAVKHGRAALADPPVDANVSAQVSNLPAEIAAGQPTTFTVTYVNNGDTDYPASALALDVVDADQGGVTPADFTLAYQYNGQAAAWGACEQEATDDGTSDVSCYLDPGEQANSEIPAGSAVTVQVTVTFTANYSTDDAQITATPVVYTDEGATQEVDGTASDSSEFAVTGQ